MTLSNGQVTLLSVSEFANICRTTPRTIRFYEKAGLIQPAQIHHENSYRYYDKRQTEEVFHIKLLQNFGMSLDDIRNIQKNHISRIIQKKLKKQEDALEEKKKEILFLQQINTLLFQKNELEKKLIYETIGPYNLFCYQIKKGRYDSISNYFEVLYTKIAELKLETKQEEMTTYLNENYNPNASDLEVSVICKISKTIPNLPKDFYFRTLPETKVISLLYQGPYAYLYFIYQKMDEYVNRSKKASHTNTFEIYLNNATTRSHYDLLTKICYVVDR